jgi:hypothetical protein
MKTKWWHTKYGKDSICAITKARLRPGKNKKGEPYTVFLSCKHGFYKSALLSWIKSSIIPTCPLCRKEIIIKYIK